MNVILLQRVPKLGEMGQVVKVKRGFLRNYLMPQNKGLPATPDNMAQFEVEREEREKAHALKHAELQARAGQLNGLSLTLQRQASEEGRLFGSITSADIVREVAIQGHTLKRSEVFLPMGPIRNLGKYEVELHLDGGEAIAKISVEIILA